MKKQRYFILLVILVLLSSSLVLAQDGGNTSTEETLANTIVPPRDLSELAQRLKGITDVPAPPTSPIRAYQVGDIEQFQVHNDDTVLTINARLVYMNDVLYMWVQDGYSLDENRLKTAADRFAAEIYQPVRDVFGSELSPGVDGDPRLHILHSNDLGAGIAGYFYSESQYPQAAVPTSNQREMFFVSVGMLNSGVDYYLSILAHEFQHMIHWAVDANEPSWMNEGLSELSAFIAGFGPSGFSSSFLGNPNTQLNYWPEANTLPVYGGGFLFGAYMLERYGIDAIQGLVADPADGMQGVQHMLDQIGVTDPFTGEAMTANALFTEWSIANYLNDTTLLDGRYGYQNSRIAGLPRASTTNFFDRLPISLNDANVNQWATRYYVLNGNLSDSVQIDFKGTNNVRVVPTDAHSGNYVYWSNRVDGSDTRLTREFDLSGVASATLNFWSWFDIEQGWDYGYVMASGDGGQTWDLLPTAYTTTANPRGISYGNAFTGRSGGWVEQSADLSAYAGGPVLVRFEYITDDATLKEGFFLDDVAVPEIGYFHDFETPDLSWTSEGWVRINNSVQQRYALHAIKRYTDGTIAVERLLSAQDTPTGQWTLTLEDNIQDLVLVVSGFAPVTTQPAVFDLQVQ